jgi:hypothetical protein
VWGGGQEAALYGIILGKFGIVGVGFCEDTNAHVGL